ncbi:MAG TPA: TetR family transcriptional regulator [Actinokineospora sp.]|nr:TetR family transcriptional regulator [Actinokineospora sp.]
MRKNEDRRRALVDAAVDVLATEGARGLTFRAVDTAAGVPAGTASNYFPSRDELLSQVGAHIHVRLAPDPTVVARTLAAPRDRAAVARFMHDILDRVTADRAGYLALLELRLEATRRPDLHRTFTATMRAQLDDSVAFHVDSGLPGDRRTVELLYIAMTGLIVESLTLPEILGDTRALIDDLVDQVVPLVAGPR